jgi:DNA-binding transcriptional regulator YhcF (GntR family)
MNLDLDPDDPRPPYQQVANALRAQILTGKLSPGERLPSQNELSTRFKVARATVQDALRILRDEGLTVARQGSGVFVRARTERPVGLRPHIEGAFSSSHVSIDFAGFSAETLHNAIQEPLDKIRIGRLVPESIAIRILLADMDVPQGLPVAVDGDTDNAAVRKRAGRIQSRSVQAVADTVHELQSLGLVKTATVNTRVHSCAPLFKLFIVNNTEAFFGFYPVVKHAVAIAGDEVPIYDPMGKDAVMFHHAQSDDDTSISSQYIEQARQWFESMWNTIAREFPT